MRTFNFSSKDMDKLFDAAMTYSVGFDDLFNRIHTTPRDKYPPYNIVKEQETEWRIDVALAGFGKEEIEISTETNVLLVQSKYNDDRWEPDEQGEYFHRGIAQRGFSKRFNIADDVEVGDVTFKDGLLTIKLKKIVPESQKRKVYDIK
jgi:molecular chaperone IbpA